MTETRKLHAALQAERARNDAYIAQLRDLLSSTTTTSLAFLSSAPRAKGLGVSLTPGATTTPLTTHTRAALEQLPALKALVENLRATTADGGVQLSRRDVAGEERREYIETQVRRRFEREGKDLDSGHGTAGSSQAAAGKRVGVDEVKSLEGVVGLLAGRATQPTTTADEGAMEE